MRRPLFVNWRLSDGCLAKSSFHCLTVSHTQPVGHAIKLGVAITARRSLRAFVSFLKSHLNDASSSQTVSYLFAEQPAPMLGVVRSATLPRDA